MAPKTKSTGPENVAELLEQFRDVPPERIRLRPAPGTATEADLLTVNEGKAGPLCELVDGVLVEKAVGTRESLLGGLLAHFLWVIDPRKETAVAYTAPDEAQRIGKAGALDGGDVLPGFRLPLRQLFEEAEEGPP